MDPLWTQIGLLVAGMVLLLIGAEFTVKGSSTMASRLGVSPIVIGVTIVALGTSAPELVVGVMASLREAQDIALGNVIGSNIANIGLIVGIAGLIYPLRVRTETLKYEIPMVILSALGLFVMASADGVIDRLDGAILIAAGILFNVVFVRKAIRDAKAKAAISASMKQSLAGDKKSFTSGVAFNLILTFLGIGMLVGGAQLMVDAAVIMAHDYLGMSMFVIGLTVVAIGTSLPELAASVAASLKKQSDIALGNVLGSNIYNIVLIMGVVAMIHPLKVSEATMGFDFPALLLFTFAFVVFLVTDRELVRWEASILLLGYVAYMVLLYLRGTERITLLLWP